MADHRGDRDLRGRETLENLRILHPRVMVRSLYKTDALWNVKTPNLFGVLGKPR
jgi:hypothetical protein